MRLMKVMSRGVSFITRFCPACVTLILHFTLFNIREKKTSRETSCIFYCSVNICTKIYTL